MLQFPFTGGDAHVANSWSIIICIIVIVEPQWVWVGMPSIMKQSEMLLLTQSLICRKNRTSKPVRTGQSGIIHKLQWTHILMMSTLAHICTGKMAEAFTYADAQPKLHSMLLTL